MGTLALIIVLSVFNGFENLVTTLFNSFNPDIRITATEGKTFVPDSAKLCMLRQINGVLCVTEVIEENALIRYRDNQYITTIKGVSKEFDCSSEIKNNIVKGDYVLESGKIDFAVIGQEIAYKMGIPLDDYENPLSVYVPRRSSSKTINPMDAFNMLEIMPSGFFSIQQDFDKKYVIVPLRFTKSLLDYSDEVSAYEIKLDNYDNINSIQENIKSILGNDFQVKNRYQQEELLYKIMKSEKFAVFIILAFILVIATFNVIGSLSMLIIDKKKDIAVLRSLGANNNIIRKIFITEGLMISLTGAIIGLFIGFIICFSQQEFGLISIHNEGSFVVDAYPVKMKILDFVFVALTNLAIGYLAAWYPVRYVSKKFTNDKP